MGLPKPVLLVGPFRKFFSIRALLRLQFAATLIPLGEDDQSDVHQQFNTHKCKSEDFSQTAVRTVKKATGKV